jgi:hypothetical protein
LNCYGQKHIHSPNIDRLAASGVLFERAYCMVPTCGASRASLMTGIRPARKRFVNYLTWAQKDAPGITTFNTQLSRAGKSPAATCWCLRYTINWRPLGQTLLFLLSLVRPLTFRGARSLA